MKSKKIKNSKKEVPKGIEMNDSDYLNSVLELEKNMSNNYSIALSEASNDYLYEDYFTMFEDTKDSAREIYNLAFEYGWYSLVEEEQEKVEEKINGFESKLKELEEKGTN